MTHRPTVFADANILLQRVLRDYTLYADTAELVTVTWSDSVLDEMTKNLVGTRLISGDTEAERHRNADRLRSLMTDAYEYATVGVESWAVEVADRIKMDQKDRHVFAAALTARADILLTENFKDFPTPTALAATGLNIRIMTFGTFLIEVLLTNPTVFAEVHRLTVGTAAGLVDSFV